MKDLFHAAWPVAAVLGAALVLYALWRSLLTRSCWRCRTPLTPDYRKYRLLKILPITRCERCGAWRGCIIT